MITLRIDKLPSFEFKMEARSPTLMDEFVVTVEAVLDGKRRTMLAHYEIAKRMVGPERDLALNHLRMSVMRTVLSELAKSFPGEL